MNTINRTLYATKRQGNFVGTILLPKGSECGQKMKYFDAVEWGVPVEYKEKKKVIDKDAFAKILAKHLVDGKDLAEHTFKNCIFECISFDYLSLYNIVFEDCKFMNCSFLYTRFNDCLLHGCILEECNLSNSVIYSDSKKCSFICCNFTKVTMGFARFDECIFVQCSLLESHIHKTNFFKCTLEKPNFTIATFNTVYFHGCNISDACYAGINITMGGATTQEVEHHRNTIMMALA